MGNQNVKFIDVTKSYLPIDPKAFPESMQGTTREDAPEQRIPAAAYEGYNFLPTPYGYKSYFGTAGKLNVDNLDARVDYIFNFQNEAFENILIALCDSGIWTKSGEEVGAWTQAYAIEPIVSLTEHNDWSYVIISDILYAFQQNHGTYQKIKSQVADPGYILTDHTPNFLNMEAQQGIFRAGGRLGFWDSDDSIAWSSLDDYEDFTPSLETLAGNAEFIQVNGRIVTIKPHGEGFMVYATRSIVYIQESTQSTFQWDPAVVLSNTGIAYREECNVAVPDTVHFAYTNTGLYKISKAAAEVIVPEVTDYLKEARLPVYPKIMEGRYLFLQLMDKDYINAQVGLSDEIVPAETYVIPGASGTLADAVAELTLRGTDICKVISGMDNAAYTDQQDALSTANPTGVSMPDKKPGTVPKPVWKCYISNNAPLNPDDITWGAVPCAVSNIDGVEQNMSPLGKGYRLDAMTQDSTNKTPLLGSDVYVDGQWTIERFVQVQTAIWQKQQENAAAYVAKIVGRAKYQEKMTDNLPSCSESPRTVTLCPQGKYVVDYSPPKFGFTKCSFWLTRYALGVIDVNTKTVRKTTCALNPAETLTAGISGWRYQGPSTSGYTYASADAACAAIYTALGNAPPGNWAGGTDPSPLYSVNCISVAPAGGSPVYGANNTPIIPAGYTAVLNTSGAPASYHWEAYKAAYYTMMQFFTSENIGEFFDIAPTPETAYCEIISWTYQKTDNTFTTVPARACNADQLYGTGGAPGGWVAPANLNPNDSNRPVLAANGSVCSIPFLPVTIPGTPDTVLDWPDAVVTIPEGDFLLQRGSIAPIYPNFEGALVYDLQLKKWGKMKGQYKQLLDYSPVNHDAGGGVPYARFGMMSGVIKSNGGVYLFDEQPLDSYIKYGKIGYYRLGMTSVEEVRVHFRTMCTGKLRVETSMDGLRVSSNLYTETEYTDATKVENDGGYSGAWHNIKISGMFDIQYLEYRGFSQGKR